MPVAKPTKEPKKEKIPKGKEPAHHYPTKAPTTKKPTHYYPTYYDPHPWQEKPTKAPKKPKGPKGHEPTKEPSHHYYPTKEPPHYPTYYKEESKSDYYDPHPWYDSSEDDAWGEYIAGYPDASKPPPPHHYEEPNPWEPNPWQDSSDEDAWGEYVAGYPGATKPPHYDDVHPWYHEPDPWHDVDPWKEPKGGKGPKGDEGKVPKGKKPKADKGDHYYKPTSMPHYVHTPQPVSKDPPKDPNGHYGDDSQEEKRVVVPFVLQYSVSSARQPTEAELYKITAQTDVFLETYLEKFFDEYLADVKLDRFVLVPTEGVDPIVDGDLISLDYKGVTFFESKEIPSPADMAVILEDAFVDENLNEYLKRVNSLPKENVFASTTEVSIITSIPNGEPSQLLKTLEKEASVSKTMSSSPIAGVSMLTLMIVVVAGAVLIASAIALVVVRNTRGRRRDDDDLSFVESVFIGDQGYQVEKEIGDEDFEVSSVHSNNNATRAENFLRLVARDEDDDYSGNSTFRIEMGGNKSFSKA